MATKAKKVSFQERLRRGLRKIENQQGLDVRTVSTADILKVSRGLVRGKNQTETAKLRKEFDASAEKKSAPVQVSIAKRNFREDGTGCEMFDGKGRPSYEELGYTEEELYGEDAA